MTMLFRTVGNALKDTLNTAAAGRYRVIGFQKQTESAGQIAKLRTVQVYYQGGQFPASGGAVNGPRKHDATYGVELTVLVPAQADMAVLGNENSTPAQLITALAAVKESSELADQDIDELIDIVWQILMDARNQDFAPADPTLAYQVANRSIDSTRKGSPDQKGSLLTITAVMNLSLSVQEEIVGEVGLPLEDLDTTITLDGDPNLNTGIIVTTP